MVDKVAASVGRQALGIILVIVASLAFGTSGAFAKSLLVTGWSPGAVVTWRVVIAAIVMVPVGLWALHGQWDLLRRNALQLVAFGFLGVAGAQFFYFNAVAHLSVAVALLLEYLGILLVVLWVWLVRHQRPHPITAAGMAVAVIGLLFVLQVFAGIELSWIGVMWGVLAGTGLATFYLTSSADEHDALPPLTLAGVGLGVGALTLTGLSVSGLIPYATASADVQIGSMVLPWWVPILEVGLIAAALAYAVGVAGTRIAGATVSSFLGLSEVVFAVLVAWLVLGELPGLDQAFGGALVLFGVILVKVGEARGARSSDAIDPVMEFQAEAEAPAAQASTPDFTSPEPVA